MIIVCSLKDLETVCESVKPSHIISVIDPGYAPKTPLGVKYHLKLGFDDIIEVNSKNKIFRLNTDQIPQLPPNQDHINSITKFVNSWSDNSPIVIHCWCGVSRSMATATYLLCKYDNSNIDRNIRYIRHIAAHANPNKLLIKLFEKSLKINSEITDAYLKYPHTTTYDCSQNFAPITIFNFNDMKKFK
ncbi:MAG: hypothetical protein CMI96_03560 [Pelagibacteraceae bacterium]|mgnify:CR=1 FL=1|nr:hypothetical protein [Pelagibacteraceae bacterium]|tara:strand:+ start:37392 stop:37955 length:564 start_codon:yes stop_codon:yes gene_type:complete